MFVVGFSQFNVMILTDLPEHILRQVFSYLSYDEIARNRIVSTYLVYSFFMIDLNTIIFHFF